MTARPTTVRNSPLSSGDLKSPHAERETPTKLSTLHRGLHPNAATAVTAWWARSAGRGRTGCRRKLLTEPPASVAELSAYAHRAGWTSSAEGTLRRLGVLWFLAVALPWTTGCRYVEWVAQRPGRALAALLVWQAVIRSTPGMWVAGHFIRPILAAAAWVFLP
jgi:hypothetical protein